MRTCSAIEQEVNQIRLKIYEETKDLTSEQYKQRLDRITSAAAKKYGFKVIAGAAGNSPAKFDAVAGLKS